MIIKKYFPHAFTKVLIPIALSAVIGAFIFIGIDQSTLEAAPAAAIRYVNKNVVGGVADGSSWDDAYIHLQDALAAAVDGDQIWVAAGVYYPDEGVGQTNDSVVATFQLTDGVKIYGGFEGVERTLAEREWETNITVLSGDIDQNDSVTADGLVTDTNTIAGSNSYHVVTTSYVTSTTAIDGFAITAGSAIGGSGDDSYGGAMLNILGNPILKNLTIIGNQAYLRGGGLYSQGQFSAENRIEMTNVAFINNRVRADLLPPRRALLNPSYAGGAIYAQRTSLVLDQLTIAGNSMEEGLVSVNDGASAIYANSASFSLSNSFVGNNRSESNQGAIRILASDAVEVLNSVFVGNVAHLNASALDFDTSGAYTMTHSTFAGNYVTGSDTGAAVKISTYGSSVETNTISNNIFWDNLNSLDTVTTTAQIKFNGSMTTVLASNIIAGLDLHTEGWPAAFKTDGGDNHDADPQFVTPISATQAPTATGYFMLLEGSPAIDAAEGDSCLPKDVIGVMRSQNGGCDIGAFEFQAVGNWTVNITDDLPDANPGDGFCDTNPYYLGSQCSLRAAIDESNALPREFMISLPAGNHTIKRAGIQEDANQTGDFDILDDVSIVGAAEDTSFIQGGADQNSGLDRVFHVLTGTTNLTISNVTVRYGHIPPLSGDGNDDGAGLLNATNASVAISNTTFTQNVVDAVGEDGGAIANIAGGTMSLEESLIVDNHAKGGVGSSGGGLFNAYGSILKLHNSIIKDNVATSKGGGVYNNRDGATVHISDTTISNNRAVVLGGGIQNGATLVMTNTTVSGNSSDDHGGGISNDSADSDFNGSHLTIAGNTADADNNLVGAGGGLWLENGAIVTLQNSMIADSVQGGDCANSASTFNDGGYNLSEDGSCVSASTSLSGDPLLAPLANNGGFGQTHLPNPASKGLNAIPAGINGCGTMFTSDQRGAIRPLEASCDIGSIETDGILPVMLHLEHSLSLTDTTDVAHGTRLTYTIVFSNSGDVIANGATITNIISAQLISITIDLDLDTGISLVYQNDSNAVWKLDNLGGGQQGTIQIAGVVGPKAFNKTVVHTAILEHESGTFSESTTFTTAENAFPLTTSYLPMATNN
ncbi:MAG: choice-of-anchor Q domain-containing protein [Anaerolineae bacterium]